MYRILIFTVLLGSTFLSAHAQDLSSQRKKAPGQRPLKSQPVKKEENFDFLFNFGTHTEFYHNVQVDDSGGLRKFDIAPTLGVGLKLPMIYDFIFLPEFNWVLPRTEGDTQIIKNLFMLRADFGYDPIDWFRVRMGTSLMWLNQHGRGGEAEMNNGNTSSTFYYPDGNQSSLNNTLDLGAEAFLNRDWSVRLQSYIYSIFIEQRRQVSYSLFITYQWDR